MADIFMSQDVQKLLKDKKVVLLGDSNMRATYKDLICLYNKNILVAAKALRNKMEKSIFDDELVDHGKLSKGRDYREHRKFNNGCKISYYFITKVYSPYMEEILSTFQEKGSPDVIIINSCLWDICRWGPTGVEVYRKNLKILMERFSEVLDKKCIVIWLTTPPISQEVRGGFLVVQLEFLKYSLRFHVLEANNYARQVVVRHGYDIVDVHYHLRMQLTERAADGIHWMPSAVRHVTNLILTHICLAWGAPLPGRYNTTLTHRVTVAQDEGDAELQYDEPGGNKALGRGQGILPVTAEKDHRNSALKDIKNEPRSLESSPAKRAKRHVGGKKRGYDTTYRGFKKREQMKRAHQHIRQWKAEQPLLPLPLASPMARSVGSPMHPVPPSPMYSPYYALPAPPVPQYAFQPNYYHQYVQNPPVPYQFRYSPGYMEPQFNWTTMRERQFGRSHRLPR